MRARFGNPLAFRLVAQARVFRLQLGRRRDLVANIVLHGVEHDQRGLARGEAEALAEAADFGPFQFMVRFQRGQAI